MVAPDPVAFSIFGFDVMWYGALIGIGIILACSILMCARRGTAMTAIKFSMFS